MDLDALKLGDRLVVPGWFLILTPTQQPIVGYKDTGSIHIALAAQDQAIDLNQYFCPTFFIDAGTPLILLAGSSGVNYPYLQVSTLDGEIGWFWLYPDMELIIQE